MIGSIKSEGKAVGLSSQSPSLSFSLFSFALVRFHRQNITRVDRYQHFPHATLKSKSFCASNDFMHMQPFCGTIPTSYRLQFGLSGKGNWETITSRRNTGEGKQAGRN
jgi:hypothetical protein